MKHTKCLNKVATIILLIVFTTNAGAQQNTFSLKKELPKKLKEISGIAKDGKMLWAIVDSKNADIYKLDLNGNCKKEKEQQL